MEGRDAQGWTFANCAGDEPYLHLCQACKAAFAIALWHGDGRPPECPRCRSTDLRRLTLET